ncbi:glycerol-3-phosphate 1-O-acyltransferase PlsY [uncultured Nitratireductor sp.]|uniref:glycerol-3-phosphate 1-O-acyltransferase PlsY n=1 Tax=uncultured Nitratireductor sp. TaxID=520953 RepID=UPI0025EDE4A0|nr:glycerol-3-phosphate 1-O-acyltransferase PlsY [uncultured Nitratireductor sp.]
MPDPISWQLALPYLIAALVFGYLLGSIPFGLVVTRLAGLGDVRKIGSGNIGATNVLRTGNKKLAALTLLGDALKGTVAVLLAGLYGPDQALAAGLGAFLGHLFPVWLGFRGGKGVATYIGAMLAINWPVGVIFCAVWLFITRYSSLSALVAAVAVPTGLYLLGHIQAAELFVLMSLIVFIKHRTNISRLIAGTETRIGGKG